MADLKRSRKIIIVCHCILNLNAKVRGIANFPELNKKIVKFLLDKEIGIIQMPCPEFTLLGEARWGQCEKQYNTPYFRKHCRKISEEIVDQIEVYLLNDYRICGVIGLDGSPSCGVQFTCQGEWGGEMSLNPDLKKQLDTLTMVPGPGVLIKELQKELIKRDIDIPFLSFSEEGNLTQLEQEEFFNHLEKSLK